EVRWLGKRIVIGFGDDLWLALHLMIAGRLHWRAPTAKPAKNALAVFEFDSGVLVLTEAGTRHRASLHVVSGEEGFRSLDAGGLEVLEAPVGAFAARLQSANHTLKRALTAPRPVHPIVNPD